MINFRSRIRLEANFFSIKSSQGETLVRFRVRIRGNSGLLAGIDSGGAK